MKAITKTRRIGGSLVITIPKLVAETEALAVDQTVEIDIKKVKTSGFGICKGLGSFTKEDKFKGQLEK
jgi:hypothetical protein